jgi:FkbM family methyltransferase
MFDFEEIIENPLAVEFCEEFLSATPNKRLLLGRNIYAKGIAELIEVGAFIDDYTDETEYLGKPVIKSKDLPVDALVVSTLLGKPFAGKKRLQEIGIRHLDYFAFYESSVLDLKPVRFWGSFKTEYINNREKFDWIESLLADEESKKTYDKIMRFRLSGNLSYMEGFTDRQENQYFESFLKLKRDGEVFVDVGGFDGFTSLEFIKRCPGYRNIYIFEPDTTNMNIAIKRLKKYDNVHLNKIGLSNKKGTARFSSGGSVSTITENGEIEINVDALDHLVKDSVSFIKMDIEGAESLAIDGAKKTILQSHPRLAICVYHKDSDFWKIPEQVFSIRDDYHIYLRHYTEGVAETVMFFVPN